MKRNHHENRQPKQSEGKRVLAFFIILAAALVIGGFLVLRSPAPAAVPGELPTVGADGYQEVRMNIRGLEYEPSTIPIRAGQKVRWIIDASAAQGCARTLYSGPLGINQVLKAGTNTIEFTPTKSGAIDFSCTMGMARGRFQVV